MSGALGLEVLDPLVQAGFEVGSIHPLQSFPAPRPPEAFVGSHFAIDASSPGLLDWLAALAEGMGGVPKLVPAEQRTLYHAAAVIASNYLVALAGQAAAVLEAAGWSREEALPALIPLMRGMVDNLSSQGLPGALIGPIRRGDPDTVARHLEALETLARAGRPLPAGTYRMLGLAALELAREAGLEKVAADRIAEALTRGGSDLEVTDK